MANERKARKRVSGLSIGAKMTYTDRDGREATGIILNIEPATLWNVRTGERYDDASRFYLWDESKRRGLWTCVMRAQESAS